MESRTDSAVRSARSRGESPAVLVFLLSFLCFPFASSHLATSILLFYHNLKYTCGGVTLEREEGWGLHHAWPHCLTLVLWICKKRMYLGWGKKGSSDGVNKCGRESSPRGCSLWPEIFPGHFSHHVLLAAPPRITTLWGQIPLVEGTSLGWVSGSAGVLLKSFAPR